MALDDLKMARAAFAIFALVAFSTGCVSFEEEEYAIGNLCAELHARYIQSLQGHEPPLSSEDDYVLRQNCPGLP